MFFGNIKVSGNNRIGNLTRRKYLQNTRVEYCNSTECKCSILSNGFTYPLCLTCRAVIPTNKQSIVSEQQET